MYEILKEHKFEAAHRLVKGYVGNCSHVHGHSWVVRFRCRLGEGQRLDQFDMVRDFGSFKLIRKWIDDRLDHATIVSDEDRKLIEFLQTEQQRYYIIAGNPTSENLAHEIFVRAQDLGIADLVAVEIEETCTSKAIYAEPS